MEDPKRRDVGLFRYSIAREPADPRLSKAERGELVRVLAAEEHTAADGSYVRVSRSTIDRSVPRPAPGRLRGSRAGSKAL